MCPVIYDACWHFRAHVPFCGASCCNCAWWGCGKQLQPCYFSFALLPLPSLGDATCQLGNGDEGFMGCEFGLCMCGGGDITRPGCVVNHVPNRIHWGICRSSSLKEKRGIFTGAGHAAPPLWLGGLTAELHQGGDLSYILAVDGWQDVWELESPAVVVVMFLGWESVVKHLSKEIHFGISRMSFLTKEVCLHGTLCLWDQEVSWLSCISELLLISAFC